MMAKGFLFSLFFMVSNITACGISGIYLINILSRRKGYVYSAVPVLGVILFSLYIFILGSISGFDNMWIYCIPSALLFFFPVHLKVFIRKTVFFIKGLSGENRSVFFYLCSAFITVVSVCRVFGVRILNDSLVYHLYLPRMYIHAGHICRVPFSEHALWPQLTEMIFTFCLGMKSVAGAKAFSVIPYLVTGAFTHKLIKYLTGRDTLSFLGFAAVISTPAFFFFSAATYVDLTITMFTAAMVYYIVRYLLEGRTVFLVTAAFACGGALSCKFTSAIIFFSAAATILLFAGRGRKARHTALFVFISLAVCFIWYLRSYLYSGNPIFPFGYNLFGSGFPSKISAEKMTFLGRFVGASTGHSMGVGKGVLDLLRLPFDLTFRPEYFGGEKIGAIYLILLPFFLYGMFRKKPCAYIKMFFIMFIIQWFFLDQMMRFLFPALPLFVVLSFSGLDLLWGNRVIKNAVYAGIIPVLLFNTAWSGYYFYQDFEYLFKKEPRVKHLDYTYRVSKFIEKNNIAGHKMLLVGENRLYYFPEGTIKESAFRNFTGYDKKNDKIGFLLAEGIEYVLVRLPGDGNAAEKSSFSPAVFFSDSSRAGLKYVTGFKDRYDFGLYKIGDGHE